MSEEDIEMAEDDGRVGPDFKKNGRIAHTPFGHGTYTSTGRPRIACSAHHRLLDRA